MSSLADAETLVHVTSLYPRCSGSNSPVPKILLCNRFSEVLKWYYDQKIISFFSSDFESVFAKHPTGKILSFVFHRKAVYFECKFWISRSAITHVQN